MKKQELLCAELVDDNHGNKFNVRWYIKPEQLPKSLVLSIRLFDSYRDGKFITGTLKEFTNDSEEFSLSSILNYIHQEVEQKFKTLWTKRYDSDLDYTDTLVLISGFDERSDHYFSNPLFIINKL